MIQTIKEKYIKWKDQRFLKKHGCSTWKQYHRRYDPDYDIRAYTVKRYYHGYPFVVEFQYADDLVARFGDWMQGLDAMLEWAANNCTNKWRHDILRVHTQTGIDDLGNPDTEWFINDIGGADVLFFAFKSEKDLAWFKLRWQ